MTGYGRGEVSTPELVAAVELRGVNSRFFEANMRLPRSLAHRENDVRDLIRAQVNRGKVSVTVALEHKAVAEIPIKINKSSARSYYKLLNDLKKALKLRERVTLDHLLKFSEVFEPEVGEESSEQEWEVVKRALLQALDAFNDVRRKEGEQLMHDLRERIRTVSGRIDVIERLSKERIPQERERLQKRVAELLQDQSVIDNNRLELEVALLADKLDVTEECVRFRSHNKFFLESLSNDEAAGRKLNFLVQEMNREANTIGAKASDAEIAHLVVQVKEELERIREQLQNIE